MVRISKQQERRSRCPKKCKAPSVKTGSKVDAIPFKAHTNVVEGELAHKTFIPKIN